MRLIACELRRHAFNAHIQHIQIKNFFILIEENFQLYILFFFVVKLIQLNRNIKKVLGFKFDFNANLCGANVRKLGGFCL